MNIKEAHQDKADTQSGEQRGKVDESEDQADKTEADAKIEYYEQMYLR